MFDLDAYIITLQKTSEREDSMKKLIAICIAMLLVFGLASFAAAFDSPGAPDIAGIVFVEGAALGVHIAEVSAARYADFKSCETGTLYENSITLLIGNGGPAYTTGCLGRYVGTVPAVERSASAGKFTGSKQPIYYKTETGPAVLMVHSGKGGCCFGSNVERYAV